jgi:hypothetical protein
LQQILTTPQVRGKVSTVNRGSATERSISFEEAPDQADHRPAMLAISRSSRRELPVARPPGPATRPV